MKRVHNFKEFSATLMWTLKLTCRVKHFLLANFSPSRVLTKIFYPIRKLSSIKTTTNNTVTSIPINQPTRCNYFFSLLLDVYVQLNMFRAYTRPSSGAQQLKQQPLVLLSERGDSSALGRGRAGRPDHDQQHCYHYASTVKPEADTAVVELLMMGVWTSETCWAVHKRQVINWRNSCI